jgi:hypothetical protein
MPLECVGFIGISSDDDDGSDSLYIKTVEDLPETRSETLEPLPLTADKNYPQEDVHYFKKISNVRTTDKFSLGTIWYHA